MRKLNYPPQLPNLPLQRKNGFRSSRPTVTLRVLTCNRGEEVVQDPIAQVPVGPTARVKLLLSTGVRTRRRSPRESPPNWASDCVEKEGRRDIFLRTWVFISVEGLTSTAWCSAFGPLGAENISVLVYESLRSEIWEMSVYMEMLGLLLELLHLPNDERFGKDCLGR